MISNVYFKRNKTAIFFLFLLAIASGSIAVVLGKDIGFDLLSYHFYTGYALWNHRIGVDYWPSPFLQFYLNPLIDLPTYFLITYTKPLITVFIMGAIQSINVFLLYLIIQKVMLYCNGIRNRVIMMMIAVLCCYAPMYYTLLGSFQGDTIVSILTLLALLYMIFFLEQKKYRDLNLSGFVFGCALGLKLTNLLFLPGFVLGLLICNKRRFTQNITACCVWSLLVFGGLLLSSGYWMHYLWVQYHNPFFPYFNGFFHSPFYPSYNVHIKKFTPDNFWQGLFYPFYFSVGRQVADTIFTDFRFVGSYFVFVTYLFFVIYKGFKRIDSQSAVEQKNQTVPTYLILFYLCGYVIWLLTGACMRYVVILELLTPVVMFILCNKFKDNKVVLTLPFLLFFIFIWGWDIKNRLFLNGLLTILPLALIYCFRNSKHLIYLLFGLYFITLSMTLNISSAKSTNYSDYFAISIPNHGTLPRKAAVLMSPVIYPLKLINTTPPSFYVTNTYLIPSLPKEWVYIGVEVEPGKPNYLKSTRMMQLLSQEENVYLVADTLSMPAFQAFASTLRLVQNGPCQNINSDPLTHHKQWLKRLLLYPLFPKHMGEIQMCPYKNSKV